MPLLLVSTLNVGTVFLAQLIILASVGPGNATDAFLAAASIPQVVSGMVAVVMSSALVPLLSGEPEGCQDADAWLLLISIGSVFSLLAIVLSRTSDWWTGLLFPGFSAEDVSLCARLARIQIFSMAFAAMGSVVMAVCYARGQFLRVEMATLATAGASISFLLLALPRFGIFAASWSITLSAFFQSLLLLPILGWPRRLGAAAATALQAWSRGKPVLAGSIYYKSEILVDRYLLSMSSSGDMTLYGVAQQFHMALTGIIGKVWGNTAIPDLSVYAKRRDRHRFLALFIGRLKQLALVTGIIYIILIAFGQHLLSFAIGYGKISEANIAELSWLMVVMGGMLIFGSLGVIISGAYYSMGDTKTPIFVSMTNFTLFVFFKFVAFTTFGMVGVALAMSCYYALNALVLAGMLPRAVARSLQADER